MIQSVGVKNLPPIVTVTIEGLEYPANQTSLGWVVGDRLLDPQAQQLITRTLKFHRETVVNAIVDQIVNPTGDDYGNHWHADRS